MDIITLLGYMQSTTLLPITLIVTTVTVGIVRYTLDTIAESDYRLLIANVRAESARSERRCATWRKAIEPSEISRLAPIDLALYDSRRTRLSPKTVQAMYSKEQRADMERYRAMLARQER